MTTMTTKIKITMSERRPMSISKEDWSLIAEGSDYSGEHEFQAFDGVRVRVRQHKDGRSIVYGYAGDWDGGGRPTRENREAGYLVEAGGDVVRAIHRVAGVLAGTSMVGEMADAAARRCIADLPAEEDEAPTNVEDDVDRALRMLDTIATSGGSGIDPGYAKDLTAATAVLRAALAR